MSYSCSLEETISSPWIRVEDSETTELAGIFIVAGDSLKETLNISIPLYIYREIKAQLTAILLTEA